VAFHQGDTVKALIEALGVPHTEVDLILVNSQSKPFDYQLVEGDRISVYPVFESFDIQALTRVRPRPLREIKFLADVHLGRLAKNLRMVGFDTMYSNAFDDETLSCLAHRDQRIILTRDRGLLKLKAVSHGYCVRSPQPWDQLTEVIDRFDLIGNLNPFSICMHCNEPLQPLDRDTVRQQLPRIAQAYTRFSHCPACQRVYWPGTHWQRMNQYIDRLRKSQR